MKSWLLHGWLIAGLVAAGPSRVAADLFDEARQVVRTDLGRADLSGVTLRGGASLTSGLDPAQVTLLQGRANVGGPCGAFDFATSVTQALEEIPGLFEALIDQILASLPMLVLCYTSPTVCDLAKHWQALVNVVIQAKYAQCQQIQAAAAYGGQRLRGGHVSQCLEDAVAGGAPINEAMRVCNSDVSSLRTPAGGQAPLVALIQDTLSTAGVGPEMQTLARTLLGEVTLSANGTHLGTQQERPQATMLRRYDHHREVVETALRRAVDELRSTGNVSADTLLGVSVPGQALPRAALEGLVTLQNDPVRRDSMQAKLASGIAIVHLTWECQELQEQLAASIENNAQLTEEQRRLIEKRLEALQRDLAQVTAKKEAVERHLLPAVEALLTEYSAVQQTATRAGFLAPSRVVPTMPYRTQQPSGYSQ